MTGLERLFPDDFEALFTQEFEHRHRKIDNRCGSRSFYMVKGEFLDLSECAKESGVSAVTLKSRMRRGLTIEEAMAQPARRYVRRAD